MANAALLYENLADAGTISVSTQVALTPGSNLQDPNIVRKWRSTAAASYFIVDLGSLQSIDTIAVIGITADMIRIRATTSDSAGLSSPVYDSTNTAVDQSYLQHIAVLTSPVSARYIRVDLTATTGDFVEAGRIVIGQRTSFGVNFAYNWSRAWVDPSIRTQTRGGQTQVSNERTYRTLDVTFDFLSESEKNGTVETIDRVNGLKTDIMLLTDPDSSNLARDTVWGLMSDLTVVANPYFGIFSKQYRIQERR